MRLLRNAILCSCTGLALAGCPEKDGPAERAGEAIDNAAEKVGETAGKATDSIKGAVEEAGDKIEKATE